MKRFLPFLFLIPSLAIGNGETISPNMSLVVPAVGVTTGPQWAADINIDLGLLDGHDHTAGKGAPITPAALNINADLTMSGNNLTSPRSVRFLSQASPLSTSADKGAVYESGVDLYYNDGNGNQIRLTQGGSIVGTSGSITGLVSPASASYNAGTSTFIWQQDVNKAANLDAASIVLRNATTSSNGVTLSPVNSLSSNYTLVLPVPPVSQKIMTLDSSGNITAPYDADNSTIQINSNLIQVKNQGITQAKLAPRATGSTVAAGGVAISSSSGNFTTSGAGDVAVTNLSVTITTTGRPIWIGVESDGSSQCYFGATATAGSDEALAVFKIANGGIPIAAAQVDFLSSVANVQMLVPCSSLYVIDTSGAGTYTYTVLANAPANRTATVNNAKLVAYEL